MKKSILQMRMKSLKEAEKEVESLVNKLPKEKRSSARKEIETGKIPKIKGSGTVKVPRQKHGLNRPIKETLGEVTFSNLQNSQIQLNNIKEIVMGNTEVELKKVGRPEMYSKEYVQNMINGAKTAGMSFTGYIKDQFKADPKKAVSKVTAIYLAARRHGLVTKREKK